MRPEEECYGLLFLEGGIRIPYHIRPDDSGEPSITLLKAIDKNGNKLNVSNHYSDNVERYFEAVYREQELEGKAKLVAKEIEQIAKAHSNLSESLAQTKKAQEAANRRVSDCEKEVRNLEERL